MFIEGRFHRALLVPPNHAEYQTRILPRAFSVDLVGTKYRTVSIIIFEHCLYKHRNSLKLTLMGFADALLDQRMLFTGVIKSTKKPKTK